MNLLKTLGGIASAFTPIGSIASGVGSLLGVGKGIAGLFKSGDDSKKQLAMQKQLMDYQNNINKANSLIDYQRQRQLTLDNASLQKQGLRAAGQNTSLGDGSFPSAESVGGTAPVSAPSPLPTQASIDAQYMQMASQGLDNTLKAAQVANLNANTSKTKTEAERARFEFVNFRDKQVEDMNKILHEQWRQIYWDSLVKEGRVKRDMAENDWWNTDAGQRVEQEQEAKLQTILTSSKQVQFDYEKAKQFKPKQFELLEKEVDKYVADIAYQKSKTAQQNIINEFNKLGIGITGDFVGSIAALLTSGNGEQLAKSSVNTIVGFLKGIIGQVKASIF